MSTAFYTHESALAHPVPQGHAERPDRMRAVLAALEGPDFAALDRREAPLADESLLPLAHEERYLAALRAARPEAGLVQLDPDTHMGAPTWEAALRGLGGCLAGVDALMDGAAQNAFVAMRPPGHHAERGRAMGFCLFANVAIAALYALERKGLSRVAIVDFDVHHGNGTQDVVERDPRIFFASTHESPLYPGTGGAHETGVGNVLNIPLPAGTDGAGLLAEYDAQIAPALDAFAPELVIVSAGFDAHIRDPLANLALQTDDYAALAERLCDAADRHAHGRLLAALEGGYDLTGLSESVAAFIRVMMRRGAKEIGQ